MKTLSEQQVEPELVEISTPRWLQTVSDRVSRLRYGVVQVVVHDGRVTQVESTEKVRFSVEEGATKR